MTFEGKIRKLSDTYYISYKISLGGGGENIFAQNAPLPTGKSHATPLTRCRDYSANHVRKLDKQRDLIYQVHADQLYIAMCFWYLVKSDKSCVRCAVEEHHVRKGTKLWGRKIKTLKNVVGEEYQVEGNCIHPC